MIKFRVKHSRFKLVQSIPSNESTHNFKLKNLTIKLKVYEDFIQISVKSTKVHSIFTINKSKDNLNIFIKWREPLTNNNIYNELKYRPKRSTYNFSKLEFTKFGQQSQNKVIVDFYVKLYYECNKQQFLSNTGCMY